MNNQQSKQVVCWYDSTPQTVDFRVSDAVKEIEVKNVWDTGNGAIESWHNGAAMLAEDISNGRRYRCDDGYADEDFDDIIFRLERLE